MISCTGDIMKIITLTLNPAFDIHCQADFFHPFCENFAAITHCSAGGKGVNLSRALTKNGVENQAVLVLGEENGDSFLKSLSADGLEPALITVPGRIRENMTLHSDGGRETRISFGGFPAPSDLLPRVAALLMKEAGHDTVITVTGRNPDGLDHAEVKAMLFALKQKGARLVIDSRSFSLSDLTELKPWLIKPNQEEISQYLGRPIENFEEVRAAAEELYASGIENVMVSLGALGALLVCGEGTFTAAPPPVKVLSTIGAGDSTIAGFLAAANQGLCARERLRLAVAFGSAACLSVGSLPPLPENIEVLKPQVKVLKLS